jgi:hypothetical protein
LCFCHAHPERLAELGRQGGQKNRRWKVDEGGLPRRSLKSIGEVIELLEETINGVRQGQCDLRAANTIGFLAGILLKAQIENELKAIPSPPENPNAGQGPGPYTSLFRQLALPAAPPAPAPLFPKPPEAAIPAGTSLPPVGESIDESATKPQTNPNILHVEIED